MSFQLYNNGPFIFNVSYDPASPAEWYVKKHIVEVIPISDNVLKIKFRKKGPVYLNRDFIQPHFSTAAELGNKIMGWITDDVCCGNYPDSDPPLSG